MANTSICVVSGDLEAIEWLIYQLKPYGDVTKVSWASVKELVHPNFDWVILDFPGRSLNKDAVVTKMEELQWTAGQVIARLDPTSSALQTNIAGLKLVCSIAPASEYLGHIAGVRA